jgi:hypothetical protein
MIARRNGDGKRKADLEDLLDLWEACMPLFCTANLSRLPPLSFTDTNVSSLATLVLDMKGQMTYMQSKLSDLSSRVSAAQQASSGATGSMKSAPPNGGPGVSGDAGSTSAGSDPGPTPNPSTSSCPPEQPHRSWADLCHDTTNADTAGFITIVGKKKQSPKKQVFSGKKVLPVDSVIRAAPRRLTIFVGRLDKDVTGDALRDYLQAADIEDAVCRKLLAKSGAVFRTAAFMVSCKAKFQDILYNESIWPAGSELRDWVFRKKEGGIS